MNNVIDITNFTGRFALSEGEYRANQFNAYVAEKQRNYLICFLGVDLYRLLETYYDGTGIPAEPIWDNFLDGVDYISDSTSYTENYEGFKELLVKLVYADWILDSKYYFNETGAFESDNENSKKIAQRTLTRRSNNVYNEAVSDVLKMFDFLYTNQTDYPYFEDFFNFLAFRGSTKITLR